jgi:oxygen-dependent protoporphyrinogen oxidase
MKRVAVIGGGISGLSALHFIRTRLADRCHVKLFEKENRLGGTIGTDRSNGFISDWGPNGFLDKVPLTLKVVSELGLDNLLERANPKSDNRFIYRNNRLHAISPSPLKFMKSPLLSLGGRARILAEPFISAKSDDNDESIYDFVCRRIGREAAETLIGPMVSGIFGGDARQLSLQACFPMMAEMEKEYGSLIKAMIAKKKAGGGGGPAGPGGKLTSFKSGLYTLVENFQEKYAEFIQTDAEVSRIRKTEDGYFVYSGKSNKENFDAIICAAPTYSLAGMFAEMDQTLAQLLDSIPYASIAVVCLGYHMKDIANSLDGFGFLIPRSEGKRILGSIWTSSIFDDRSPDGMVQFRTMIGGATDPEAANLSNDSLLDLVTGELREIIGIKGTPTCTRIFKYEKGIPQFVCGHPDKMKRLAEMQKKYPGLFFTGNAYDGVGLNDCITRSDRAVEGLGRFLS